MVDRLPSRGGAARPPLLHGGLSGKLCPEVRPSSGQPQRSGAAPKAGMPGSTQHPAPRPPSLSGSPGEEDNPRPQDRQEEGPFLTPSPGPASWLLGFYLAEQAYRNPQLSKHTNPRLVRENPLPELFISCSQAPRCPCQQHRRRPDCGTGGSSFRSPPSPLAPAQHRWHSPGSPCRAGVHE